MLRVKRFVVRGVSHWTGGLSGLTVERFTGQSYTPEGVTDGVQWTHWTLARTCWSARRNSRRVHAAFVAREIALCGPDRHVSSGPMGCTDAGF